MHTDHTTFIVFYSNQTIYKFYFYNGFTFKHYYHLDVYFLNKMKV